MTRFALVGLLSLALGTASEATCRVAFVKQKAVVVEKAVAVETALIAQFVAIPAYSVGYSHPPAEVAVQVQAKPTCEEKLSALEKRIAELEAGQTVTTQTKPAAIVSLFQSKCASCHDAAVSKTKGHSFTLLTGDKLADLTPEQVNRVVALTYSGKMPKGGKLTDQDFAVIMDWVSTRKSK